MELNVNIVHQTPAQPNNIPSPRSSGTSRPLIGVGLTDGSDLKGIHTDFGVVHLQLAESRIHDIHDTVNYRNEPWTN